MKKYKLFPTIIMLVLCVGVLAVGVFALTPSVNTISGNLGVGSSPYEIGIEAYKYNSDGTMQSTPFYSASSVRAGIDIPLTGLGFSMTNVNKLDELSDLDIKITFKLTNKSGVALGAYFSITPTTSAAKEGDVKKERELTTNLGLNDVVKATMTGYTEISTTTPTDMHLTFSMLRFINGDDQTVNLSQDINRIYLNVETFNEELEEEVIYPDEYYEQLNYIIVGESGADLTPAIATEDINAGIAAGKDGTKIKIADGVTSLKSQGTFQGVFSQKTTITEIIIPNSVISIDKSSFYRCTGLTSITIPNSVFSIGSYAFRSCSKLTSVKLGTGLTSIGDSAFDGCTGLTSITIPNSVTSIGGSAFWGCTGLTSISLGRGVTSIDNSAFRDCIGLTSVIIPENVITILPSAFKGCTNLISVSIESDATRICQYAFDGCEKLRYETYGNAKYLGNESNPYLFLWEATSKSITSASVHSNTKSIADRAFSSCDNLTSITIPNGVISIGDAFYYCDSLTSITIPNSVISLRAGAFYYCSSLATITVEKGIATEFECYLPYAYTLNGTTACTTSTKISRSATENNVYTR